MQERKINNKKVLKATGIIGISIFDIFCLLLLFEVANSGNERCLWAYITVIIMMLSIDLFLGCVIHKVLKMEDEREKSGKTVNCKLSSGKYVEVMPVPESVPPRYYTFINSELPSVARFFAILDKDGNEVRIELKLNDHEEYHFFEHVEIEIFTSLYEIKE